MAAEVEWTEIEMKDMKVKEWMNSGDSQRDLATTQLEKARVMAAIEDRKVHAATFPCKWDCHLQTASSGKRKIN